MEQTILVISDVANYYQAENNKEMRHATRKKIIETDPYWVAPHAFKTQDLELYIAYRFRLNMGARQYWDTMMKIDPKMDPYCPDKDPTPQIAKKPSCDIS